jgi:ABC-type glycerol-3-phosphate transport system substrate-binding protein
MNIKPSPLSIVAGVVKAALAGALIWGINATVPAHASVTIRLMTWGGHWLDIFRPIAEKFEKDTSNKVEFVV